MKKILFAALALAGLLTTSCENDPIEITTVAPKHDVTLNVSTQAMYDQFGIANDIRSNFLNAGNKTIGITAFVFDSVGVYIDKIQGTSSSMSVVKLNVDELIEGEYTFVTIETMVDESTGKSDVWNFDSAEKITDMKISQTAIPAYQNVLGVNTQTINLKSDEAITIEPKAIGSMVNFNCYNFVESPFENLGFTTNTALSYYSLDPNLQRKDRFHLSQSGSYVIRGTISVDDSKNEVLKFYLPEAEINWECKYQEANGVAKNIWNSNDDNYGAATLGDGVTYEVGYYYLDNKLYFTKTFYGTQGDLTKWAAEQEELLDYIHVEPFIEWNSDVATVREYMKDYNIWEDADWYPELPGFLWVLDYEGKYKEYEIRYFFMFDELSAMSQKTSGLSYIAFDFMFS